MNEQDIELRRRFVFTLEQMAIVKVASLLWRKQEFRHELEVEEQIEIVEQAIKALDVTFSMKEDLVNVVNQMASEIVVWCKYKAKRVVPSENPYSYSRLIQWTCRGMVDERETAKFIIAKMDKESIHKEKACDFYCIKENKEIDLADIYFSLQKWHSVCYRQPRTKFRRNTVSPPSNRSKDIDLQELQMTIPNFFDFIASRCHEGIFKTVWGLSNEEQRAALIAKVNLKHYTNLDLIIFIFAQMSPEQRENCFQKLCSPDIILESFLHPSQGQHRAAEIIFTIYESKQELCKEIILKLSFDPTNTSRYLSFPLVLEIMGKCAKGCSKEEARELFLNYSYYTCLQLCLSSIDGYLKAEKLINIFLHDKSVIAKFKLDILKHPLLKKFVMTTICDNQFDLADKLVNFLSEDVQELVTRFKRELLREYRKRLLLPMLVKKWDVTQCEELLRWFGSNDKTEMTHCKNFLRNDTDIFISFIYTFMSWKRGYDIDKYSSYAISEELEKRYIKEVKENEIKLILSSLSEEKKGSSIYGDFLHWLFDGDSDAMANHKKELPKRSELVSLFWDWIKFPVLPTINNICEFLFQNKQDINEFKAKICKRIATEELKLGGRYLIEACFNKDYYFSRIIDWLEPPKKLARKIRKNFEDEWKNDHRCNSCPFDSCDLCDTIDRSYQIRRFSEERRDLEKSSTGQTTC